MFGHDLVRFSVDEKKPKFSFEIKPSRYQAELLHRQTVLEKLIADHKVNGKTELANAEAILTACEQLSKKTFCTISVPRRIEMLCIATDSLDIGQRDHNYYEPQYIYAQCEKNLLEITQHLKNIEEFERKLEEFRKKRQEAAENNPEFIQQYQFAFKEFQKKQKEIQKINPDFSWQNQSVQGFAAPEVLAEQFIVGLTDVEIRSSVWWMSIETMLMMLDLATLRLNNMAEMTQEERELAIKIKLHWEFDELEARVKNASNPRGDAYYSTPRSKIAKLTLDIVDFYKKQENVNLVSLMEYLRVAEAIDGYRQTATDFERNLTELHDKKTKNEISDKNFIQCISDILRKDQTYRKKLREESTLARRVAERRLAAIGSALVSSEPRPNLKT
ncbi:MAG TPA: hypothetical protein VHZ76_08015 [Gammaproteobacteria bacterium]|jgi:hypothetical protein|nr:hypothetical protein [Gammaproteobacteria bacterium]